MDHNRARLGRGRDTFERAVAALYSWKMFDVGWARLVPADAPVEELALMKGGELASTLPSSRDKERRFVINDENP